MLRLICFGPVLCGFTGICGSHCDGVGSRCTFLNPLINGRIHGGFFDGELAGYCFSKPSSHHDTNDSMPYILHYVIFLTCYIWFKPTCLLVSAVFCMADIRQSRQRFYSCTYPNHRLYKTIYVVFFLLFSKHNSLASTVVGSLL